MVDLKELSDMSRKKSKRELAKNLLDISASVKDAAKGLLDRVCNMKNQPPSFGKLTFIPCRTPWYLNKHTLKVQILQLVWQKCSQGQRLS